MPPVKKAKEDLEKCSYIPYSYFKKPRETTI